MPLYETINWPNSSFDTLTASVGVFVTGGLNVVGSITASQGGYFIGPVTVNGDLIFSSLTSSLNAYLSGNTIYKDTGSSGQMVVGWLGGNAQVSTLTNNDIILKSNNVQALVLRQNEITASANFVVDGQLTSSNKTLISNNTSIEKSANIVGSLTASGRAMLNNETIISGTITNGFEVKASDGVTTLRCNTSNTPFVSITPDIVGKKFSLITTVGLNGVFLESTSLNTTNTVYSIPSGVMADGFKISSNFSVATETQDINMKEIFRAGNIGNGREVVGINTCSVPPATADTTLTALYGCPTTRDFCILPAGGTSNISKKDLVVNGSLTGSGKSVFLNSVVISGTSTTGFQVKDNTGFQAINVRASSIPYISIYPSIASPKVQLVSAVNGFYTVGSFHGFSAEYDATYGQAMLCLIPSGNMNKGFVVSVGQGTTQNSYNNTKEIFRAGNIGNGKEVVGINTCSVPPATADTTLTALYGCPTTRDFCILPASLTSSISGNLRVDGYISASNYPLISVYSGNLPPGGLKYIEHTLQPWTKYVRIVMVAGGAGGGSGRRGAAGSVRNGGCGGTGGGYSDVEFFTHLLPSRSFNIEVGAGGAGGAGPTTDDTDGLSGSAVGTGGRVYLGNSQRVLFASTSYGTPGGTQVASVNGGRDPSQYGPGTGGAGSSAGGAGGTGGSILPGGGGGGGGGGGITTGDVANAGGNGGNTDSFMVAGYTNAGVAGSPGYAMPNNVNFAPTFRFRGFNGCGGGGGHATTPGNGGDALWWQFGAGGGGGGGMTNGVATPARGGNGGPGVIAFIEW